MALSANARPIAGAVATLGVSDRVAFLRKTYTLLTVALAGFAGMTAGSRPKPACAFHRGRSAAGGTGCS